MSVSLKWISCSDNSSTTKKDGKGALFVSASTTELDEGGFESHMTKGSGVSGIIDAKVVDSNELLCASSTAREMEAAEAS